jgi:hypothetical protein
MPQHGGRQARRGKGQGNDRERRSPANSRAARPLRTAIISDCSSAAGVATSVALFDQGLLQVLQASVTGLEPRRPYVLALSRERDGGGVLEPLAAFTTNPARSAIVNAIGPIRQVVRGEGEVQRRYLVIAPGTADQHGAPVQIQVE